MDVYDSALTQSQPQNESGSKSDSQSTSQSTQQADAQQPHPQSPTLEQEVQQLVGGITSWWSGVSKKSQESIAQAQSHIQSQGGILNLARKELSHFEDQISQAQSNAREQSLKSQSPQKEKTTSDLGSNSEKDVKGKGKAKEEDLDDEESNENEIEVSTNKTTTEIHDVNSPGGFNEGDSELKLDFEKSRELALKEARNAANFASGLFNRLANETGPRMANLGKQLQDSLNKNSSLDNSTTDSSASKEVGGENENENENSGSSEKQQTKGNGLDLGQTLNSLTKTFQKSIPNLDLEKSQSLARKYLQASEKGLKEAGKEMNGLLNDLIKIVPEDGKTLEEHQQNNFTSDKEIPQVGGESKVQGKEKKEKEVEEEIFNWDNENEEGNRIERRDEKSKESQQQQVETTTRPETGNLSLDEKEKASDGKALKENQVEEDDDEDDDWE